MATSSSSVASLTAPPTFTGVSKFSTSLQQVLTRAVGIASLPLDALKAAETDLTSRQSALQSLDSTFLALQESVSSLQYTLTNSVLTSSSSNTLIASASVLPGATAGSYSIEVQNLGAFSTALSNAGTTPVTDPTTQSITGSIPLTLTLGAVTETITPASSSLEDLASAINTQATGQVQAAIVNVGSSGSPDYRISLTAINLGTDAIGLTDSTGTNLIATSTPGSLAAYVIDGSSGSISSSTRSITLSPGLTVNLVGQSPVGQATTITVANDPANLEAAFSSFATSYNAAVAALRQQHGKSAGPLQGESLLDSLSGTLGELGTYSNGSPASALANYGVTVDQNGQLSVDAAKFTSAANADFSGLLATLGSSTTGGFLKTATDLLGSVENTTGYLPSEESDIAARIATQQTKIANEQTRVTQLQNSLTAEIARADSTIASLETQVSYVTGLFGQYTGATNTQSNGLSTL